MNIQKTEQYKFCHAANAAKAINLISTAVGCAGAVISSQELYDGEMGTPTQIATLALPTIVLVGRSIRIAYEKCRGRSASQWIPFPAPYCLGLGVGMFFTGVTISTPGGCIGYNACQNGSVAFVKECDQLFGECQKILKSPDVWYKVSPSSPDDLYCNNDPCPEWLEGCHSVVKGSEIIKILCSRILQPGEGYSNVSCTEGWNLRAEYSANITYLQNKLFSYTQCDLTADQIHEQIKSVVDNGITVGLVGGLVLVIGSVAHPLFREYRNWPFRIHVIDKEKDPILSKFHNVSFEEKTNPFFLLLENI